MSAPVPLNSGCCAPPCPNNPQTAVPGPAGENAFSFTVGNFSQPVVGGSVTVSLTHDGWVVPGQVVFVQGGGFYTVASVSGLSVTLTNTGTNGNAAPGAVIVSGAKISPGGVGGVTGNAFTTTTVNFTQPAVSSTVNVAVLSSAWAAVGQVVFIATGGYYTVFSIPDSTHITITNLGYSGNAAPAAVINSPQQVTPGGLQGPTGSGAGITLNSLSPTTTKGDLIVDNGANSPLANDVRLAAGTNGQLLAADSTQSTGLGWKTVLPNSVSTSGDIAIFNGASGTPNPLQDSKMLITADGALQSTPTGGNARGAKAVDLQVTRAGNAMVASGTNSGILSGESNTASNTDSVVAGGNQNSAIGFHSAVCGGISNLSSGSNSFVGAGNGNTASSAAGTVAGGNLNTASGSGGSAICGGDNNISSGTDSFVGAGNGNQATAQESSVVGGNGNVASVRSSCVLTGISAKAYLQGQVAWNTGVFALAGDAQASELLWRISTTDATAGVESFLDGAGVRAVIPLNTTWAFEIYTIGRSSAGVCAMFKTEGAIQNNANTVSLVAAVVQSVVADGTGGTWGVTVNHVISADNTNKSLKVAVTGAVATNIRWVTRARMSEVSF